MEFEYQDTSKRGRWIMILGVVLALVAGGLAFSVVSGAGSGDGVAQVPVVVAARTIPGRKTIEAGDLTVRQMPADLAGSAAVADPTLLLARVTAVTILEGQVVSTNLLASSEAGGQFSILKPEEKVTADSPFWRAVAITVPDERAVAGLVQPGMTVDVFVTATVAIPENGTQAGFYTDKSTKVTYQGLEVLAKNGTGYVIRVPLGVAEEIEHLQATGAVQFSLALRPAEDTRIADAGKLGATTNLVIQRYGLPVPMTVPTNGNVVRGTTNAWPIPTLPPVTTVATTPEASPQP